MSVQRSEVLDDLRSRITSGVVAPGAHLTEIALAAEYGTSRTPIRWTLQELAREGLVVIEPNRGAFVAEWTTEDAAEVMTLRALLESRAAALAASRITADMQAQLMELCDEMDRLAADRPSGFRDQIASLNSDFHLAVLRAAASPRLFNIAKDLANVPLMHSSFQYYEDADIARSLSDHRALAEAIARGNAEHAHAIMEAHLRSSYAAVSRERPGRQRGRA